MTSAIAVSQGPLMLASVMMLAWTGYGWRGLIAIVASGALIALCIENLSIATGFPFGYFEHGNSFGVRVGAVPVVVAMGYVLFGYPAWLLAQLIAGDQGRNPALLTILIGAMILTGFDLTVDAIGATAQGLWTYRTPSGLNGVPLTNFGGWIITSIVILTTWRVLLARFTRLPPHTDRAFWALPIAFWAITALQYVLMWTHAPLGKLIKGERSWLMADIYESAAIHAILVMGFVVLLAVTRLLAPVPARGSTTPD